MTSTKTILVPIDFSETTEKSLVYASNMAKKLGTRLVLLHVVDSHFGFSARIGPTDSHTEHLKQRVNAELAALAKRLVSEDVPWSTAVLTRSSAKAAIVDHANSIGAEMIVMGTHGRKGLAHFYLGSTAEDVVRRSHCPVMTIGLNDWSARAA